MKVTILAYVILVLASSEAFKSSSTWEDTYNVLLQRVDGLEAKDAASRLEVKEMKTKMAAMETQFAQKIANMNFELQQYKHVAAQSTNAGVRRAVAQTQIAFYAIVSQHYVDHINIGDRVLFDQAYTNLGNAYHPQSGQFIAPISGTYVISVTLSGRKTDGSTSYFTVNVNNETRGKLLSHTLQQDTNTLILELRAGDSVSVTTGNGENGLLGVHYSTFSGFLLYER